MTGVYVLLQLEACDLGEVEVSTVDSFQGRDKEAVILSFVRNNPDGKVRWASNPEKHNSSFDQRSRFRRLEYCMLWIS